MAPRIPGDEDETLEDEGLLDEGENAEAEDESEDEGSGVGDEGQGDDGSQNDRQTAEDGRERRVLERGQRETPLAKANRLAREAREETNRLSREMAELRAEQQRARQPPAETAEQEQARLALMDPEQRSEYRLNKVLEQNNRQMQAMQFRFADQADKAAFSSLAANNPLYKRVEAQVEAKLVEVRRLGQNVDREALAKFLIGEQVLARGPKAAQQQKRAGQQNIQRQQARPGAARSDQAGASAEERQRAQRMRRLENVVF